MDTLEQIVCCNSNIHCIARAFKAYKQVVALVSERRRLPRRLERGDGATDSARLRRLARLTATYRRPLRPVQWAAARLGAR